jgi:large subunit ribosomal protein L9
MELLLKKSIDELGRVGDVVTVKPGYARNYLLPLGLAVPVTKANLAQIEKERIRALAEERQRVDGLKELAQRIRETSVTIEGRANEEGHLFGSVTAAQISEALREKGFPLDVRSVRLEHPLKEIGVFDVPVHLHADVETEVKVWVVQAKPS